MCAQYATPTPLYLVIRGRMPGHIYALFAVAFVVASDVAGHNEWHKVLA